MTPLFIFPTQGKKKEEGEEEEKSVE